MPPVSGEQFLVVLGSLSTLGGIALGLKRVHTEMVEVARVTASMEAGKAIAAHVKEKHDPLAEILVQIQVGIARIESYLAERSVALGDRITDVEDRCAENVRAGLCAAPPRGQR